MKSPMWPIISFAVFALAACAQEAPPSYATRGDCLTANKVKLDAGLKASADQWDVETSACSALGPNEKLKCRNTAGFKRAATNNRLKAENIGGELRCKKLPEVAQR